MKNFAIVSCLVAVLSLVAASPVPDDENRHISFTTTTVAPTTTKGLVEQHQNLSSVCESMTPAHNGNLPQTTPAPYTTTVSAYNVAPKAVIQVSFASVGGEALRGVYTQARTPEGTPVGYFVPSDDPHIILSNCGEGENNAATYVSRQPVTDPITFNWIAPEEPVTVTFTTTFVESFSKFWVGVKSEPVTVQ